MFQLILFIYLIFLAQGGKIMQRFIALKSSSGIKNWKSFNYLIVTGP